MVPKARVIEITKKILQTFENCELPPTVPKQSTQISTKLCTHDPNSKPDLFSF